MRLLINPYNVVACTVTGCACDVDESKATYVLAIAVHYVIWSNHYVYTHLHFPAGNLTNLTEGHKALHGGLCGASHCT